MNEQQWVTVASTMTLAGSTVGVTMLLAMWRKLTGKDTVWVVFLLSVVVVTAVMVRASGWPGTFLDWIVLAVNIALVFLSVIGANEGADHLKNPPPKATGQPNAAARKVWIASVLR